MAALGRGVAGFRCCVTLIGINQSNKNTAVMKGTQVMEGLFFLPLTQYVGEMWHLSRERLDRIYAKMVHKTLYL